MAAEAPRPQPARPSPRPRRRPTARPRRAPAAAPPAPAPAAAARRRRRLPSRPRPGAAGPARGRSGGTAADEAASGGDNRLLSPVVRRLVNEHGLDPAAIDGHRHRRADHPRGRARPHRQTGSRAAPAAAAAPPRRAAAPAAAPRRAGAAPPRPRRAAAAAAPRRPAAAERAAARAGERDESVRLSKIRQLTGDHMVMSKAMTPHAFSVVEVDYANVDRTRTAVKDEWKASEGFSLTYLPFISRARRRRPRGVPAPERQRRQTAS